MKSIKVATLDTHFRKAVQASTDRTCQARNVWYKGTTFERCPECGNQQGGGDDVAHNYGRRYRGGRWWPDNVAMLCRGFHEYMDTHDAVKFGFFLQLLGEDRHDDLIKRMHATFNYTPHDRWEIGQHFREETKRIEQARKDGGTGIIKLVSYE